MHRVSVALSVAVMTAAPISLAQDVAAASFAAEQVKRGADLYAKHCESCHGVRMVGPEWASDLKTFPRDNPRRFVDSVTHGKNAMPPWGDVLSAAEIAALWAYVVAGEP
jgi:mono/diheme cytochrome c family protein